MSIKAFIAGCTGTELSEEEVAFFREEQPWGFILFARNIEERQQVQRLTRQMRECVGRADAPILIDEEGGRVQRLRPPQWNSYPPGRKLGDLFVRDNTKGRRAAWLQARLIAHDLDEIGINVDCLPVLDVPVEGAHDAIGDRAYSLDPDVVGEIGKVVCEGLLAGGVLPIVKHMPGHGRAFCDSHFDLPRVDIDLETLLESDFKPFKHLNDAGMAMSAHIVFEAIDGDNPTTTSARLIEEIIRGKIGFDGLLMSDDISMQALCGDYSKRTKSTFAAGCDIVLHCNGLMEEMREVAEVTPVLAEKALERANRALAQLRPAGNEDIE
ncbi:MAG: beta-N-acetylhexosaminidase, partial [Rhizobiaceae bacterium]|nr:beta-N-acetylhexosaminidase [Rhizobiaceae bacterium]